MASSEEGTTCVLCGVEIEGYGANPAPLAEGRCCDWCDGNIVIPLRIRRVQVGKLNPRT